MPMLDLGDVTLNYRIDGPEDGAPVVFANSLGTSLAMWDPLLPHLPAGLRILRFDKRGHGASSVPPAPYSMGGLIHDTERLLDRLGWREVVFVGLSIGGMIAQGLAVKRLDLIRGLVLSNTAAKMGTPESWAQRMDAIRADGMAGVADMVMERWFSPAFLASDQLPYWRDMMLATPAEGYLGCCAAIAGTDFFTPTSGLRLPTLGIAGTEDRASPPDMVRETVDLIPGSQFELIRGGGHLPHVERPEAYAAALTGFLRRIGHVA